MSQTDVDEIDFMDPAVQEDWFPHYRRLREEAPVWRVPSTGEYFLSRYDDVTYVLRHPELFPHTSTSSEFRLLKSEAAMRYYEEHGWRRKQTLGIDPPVHREYRVLVDPWFNAAGAEQAARGDRAASPRRSWTSGSTTAKWRSCGSSPCRCR